MNRVLYVTSLLAMLGACLSCDAQSLADAKSQVSPHYQQERLALASAPVKTREDLVRYLQEPSANNPIMLLSADSRQRLLASVTTNSAGEITSYRIEDIRRELTPSEAARVFALFGSPEMASRVNNGLVKTQLDRDILAQKDTAVHPNLEGYYCNGNVLCQENTQSNCVDERCGIKP